MNDLQKYKLVNSCETLAELKKAIILLADNEGFIQGRQRKFVAEKMSTNAELYILDITNTIPPNVLTRSWGIRQQAMYLKYYL